METILSGQFHNWLGFIRFYLETQPKHHHLLSNHLPKKKRYLIITQILSFTIFIIIFWGALMVLLCLYAQYLEDSKIRISSCDVRMNILSSHQKSICVYIYVVHCTEFAPETRFGDNIRLMTSPSSICIAAPPCHISFGIIYKAGRPWGASVDPLTSGCTNTRCSQMVGPSFCTIVNRLSRSTPSNPMSVCGFSDLEIDCAEFFFVT